MFDDDYGKLLDLCVELRKIIPDKVNGVSTESMVNYPEDVVEFAIVYINELKNKIKKEDV